MNNFIKILNDVANYPEELIDKIKNKTYSSVGGWLIRIDNHEMFYTVDGILHMLNKTEHPQMMIYYFNKDVIMDKIALDESVINFFKNCDTFYIHKKRKTWYKILHNATMQCNTSGGIELDDEEMIVYMDVEGKVWVRSSYEFFDGRFTKFVLTKIDDSVIGN